MNIPADYYPIKRGEGPLDNNVPAEEEILLMSRDGTVTTKWIWRHNPVPADAVAWRYPYQLNRKRPKAKFGPYGSVKGGVE